MRAIIVTLVGLSLCQIAGAQVLDSSASGASSAPEALSTVTAQAVPLTANTLYMCEFKSNSQLFKLNPTNAQATVVGSMQTNERCTDLTFRTTTASGTELFGTSFNRLYKVNPTTGKATLLPNNYGTGLTNINALVAQPGSGKLYGANATAPGKFIEINPTTGIGTLRGNYGTGIGSAGDLAFLNGQLYGLVTKTGSGARTFLAKISLASGSIGKATNLLPIQRRISGNLVQQNDVWGLVVRSGTLNAVMHSGELLTINASTGVATLKGDNNKQHAGLAISP
ncbi:MAG: hypothetical protein KA760_01675 [Steroidobacteraceae bacterium]|jgi:hypothetical protein|nr:hypothetical protein [Pseudomonadota bacterium]MBP7608176.1 hypothetical protein [Steroidobacteraceae bacterium]MBP9129478.1 hypothetical protein [Steroidobacteraceae bacterium]